MAGGGWRNWSAKRWAFIFIRLTVAAFVLDVYLPLIPPGRHGRDLIVLAATTGVLAGLVWQSKRRRRRHHQARHATYERWEAGTFAGYLTTSPDAVRCTPAGVGQSRRGLRLEGRASVDSDGFDLRP